MWDFSECVIVIVIVIVIATSQPVKQHVEVLCSTSESDHLVHGSQRQCVNRLYIHGAQKRVSERRAPVHEQAHSMTLHARRAIRHLPSVGVQQLVWPARVCWLDSLTLLSSQQHDHPELPSWRARLTVRNSLRRGSCRYACRSPAGSRVVAWFSRTLAECSV